MNTSARCLRSFAAGLAWCTLLFLVLGLLPTLLKIIPFNLSWYSWHDFKTTFYDFIFIVLFQSFLVLMTGCTNIILGMSIILHSIISMFMVLKLAIIDFNQIIPASSGASLFGIVTIKFFFYFVTFISFLNIFFVFAIYYSLLKNKKNDKDEKKTTTSFPVATIATPLLNPTGQASSAATKESTMDKGEFFYSFFFFFFFFLGRL